MTTFERKCFRPKLLYVVIYTSLKNKNLVSVILCSSIFTFCFNIWSSPDLHENLFLKKYRFTAKIHFLQCLQESLGVHKLILLQSFSITVLQLSSIHCSLGLPHSCMPRPTSTHSSRRLPFQITLGNLVCPTCPQHSSCLLLYIHKKGVFQINSCFA